MSTKQEKRILEDVKGVLSKQETINREVKIIHNWKPQSDVWVLIYGRALLIGAASFTGAYINLRYRRKLRLRDYGLFPTMLSLTTTPAVATSILYSEYIMHKLLLLDITCPLCLESRAAILQTFTGLILPLMLTPIANFAVTSGSGVFNTPHYTDVKGMFKIISSAYKPMFPKIATLFTLHVLLANVISYLQIKSFIHIKDIQYIMKLEKEEGTLRE